MDTTISGLAAVPSDWAPVLAYGVLALYGLLFAGFALYLGIYEARWFIPSRVFGRWSVEIPSPSDLVGLAVVCAQAAFGLLWMMMLAIVGLAIVFISCAAIASLLIAALVTAVGAVLLVVLAVVFGCSLPGISVIAGRVSRDV